MLYLKFITPFYAIIVWCQMLHWLWIEERKFFKVICLDLKFVKKLRPKPSRISRKFEKFSNFLNTNRNCDSSSSQFFFWIWRCNFSSKFFILSFWASFREFLIITIWHSWFSNHFAKAYHPYKHEVRNSSPIRYLIGSDSKKFV